MNKNAAHLLATLAASLLCAACTEVSQPRTAPQPAPQDPFFVAPPDAGANLPTDRIYPRGRKMAYMGYSGVPARDLTNGFTVAGPVYGNQTPYLNQCFTNRWPVIAHIGGGVTFQDKNPNKYKVDEPSLRSNIASQVRSLAGHMDIAWWAVSPEELRPWRGDEMKYLAIVSETIRTNDPAHRPIYIYNPNNRDAGTLTTIAKYIDVIGKGCYVNSCGKKRDRVWVRWSVEQELAAVRSTGRAGGIALVMPELCQDPEPGEDTEIRAWVRHDVYLGLVSGAKGMLTWSLFPRGSVKRTWGLWYNAYAECGRELNGARGLSQIFLFGEPRSNLLVKVARGAQTVGLKLGGDAEPETTSEQERANREVKAASWTKAEYAYGDSRWLFLVNSANTNAAFELSGWPKQAVATNAFDDNPVVLPDDQPLVVDLPAYGVYALKISRKP